MLLVIVDLKEQLLDWTTPVSADENYDDSDDNRMLQQPDSHNEESAESVPKRLADLRSQLSNKKNALIAAKEASTFDSGVCILIFVSFNIDMNLDFGITRTGLCWFKSRNKCS